MIRLPVDLEPHYRLLAVNALAAKGHAHRHHNRSGPTIKGQKVGGGPVPEILALFPETVGTVHPLISL